MTNKTKRLKKIRGPAANPRTPKPKPELEPVEIPKVVKMEEADLWSLYPDVAKKAVEALVELMGSFNPEVRLHAAKLVLERMYGRSTIKVDATHRHGFLTHDLQRAEIRSLVMIAGAGAVTQGDRNGLGPRQQQHEEHAPGGNGTRRIPSRNVGEGGGLERAGGGDGGGAPAPPELH